ncbi:rab11 family-interacting protein 1 [Diorhabda carinulata]|uniref:rab11 family-interacting protein 1 n=1 Tax=Diorhabda carinulata TaxID=1163345 RepID=UPI0025A29446|nr:rab11 family-interacting protein 1 [Diorhabda carinulata]
MWMPTHVQVTVQRAEKILLKGKNNTNDCFVTIALGKTKYQTSVKEKSGQQVEWHEECELPIPDQGNTAEIILTVLHHNYLGIDEFLGRVNIPLNTLDIYERPKNKWFELQSKPGKNSKKERGQLEVKIGFTVKSGSLTNLSKKEKHKSSLSHVAQSVGGSLMSLGSAEKRKGIKKFAKSIGSKMNLKGKKKDYGDGSSIGSVGSLTIQSENEKFHSKQSFDDADPGVVSDDDDFTLDDLSHKSSASSLNHPISNKTASPILKNSSIENISHAEKKSASASIPPIKPPRIDQKPPQDEWESKLIGNKPRVTMRPGSSESLNRRSWDSSKLASQIEEEPSELLEVPHYKLETISLRSNKSPEALRKDVKEGMFSKFKNFRKDKHELLSDHETPINNSSERIIIGGETEIKVPAQNYHISNELLQKYEGKSRKDLILSLVETKNDLEKQKKKLKDLEDYLDDLLLRVMETTPCILQNPYVTCKMAAKHTKMTS